MLADALETGRHSIGHGLDARQLTRDRAYAALEITDIRTDAYDEISEAWHVSSP